MLQIQTEENIDMYTETSGQSRDQNECTEINIKILLNSERSITMLEKALDRLFRQNYHNRNQYPDIFFEIEKCINITREWIEKYKFCSNIQAFSLSLGLLIRDIGELLAELILILPPINGKKQTKKSKRKKERNNLLNNISSILKNISAYVSNLKHFETPLKYALEKWLLNEFKKHCESTHEFINKNGSVSGRGEKTYVIPFSDLEAYQELVLDKKRFKKEIVDKLDVNHHSTGHKASCGKIKKYTMFGSRTNDRKTINLEGKKVSVKIRVVKCKDCGETFSLIPSFLPREKHYMINIIGFILRGILLFSHSIQSRLEDMKTLYGGISKQTIFNWLLWIGKLHPATILTRSEVSGTGYLQEDEGFEKEPHLRTYTVMMVDPKTMLVWHTDYLDHVDHDTLESSFEEFCEKIDFKVIGVTKDKWQASTNALKSVFKRIWIGYCHRHCLKNFNDALMKYQKKSQCSDQVKRRLYEQFEKILKKSTSEKNLKIRVKSLTDPAFKDPLIKKRVDELIKNAAHYTCHNRKSGIKLTTSIVDNFLKLVKRKLRQVESFRDKDWAHILFRGMANVRNFIPFMSGAKNAHKSPFMLANGETYNLPWIEVMNVHNAFLFTPEAF